LRGAKRRSNLPGQGKQSGYLLLPVAVAIALIGVIAFLISSESAIEVDMTANELEAARAEYVAQAGLQHALRHHAQQGCGPYTDLTTYPFGNDEYDTSLATDLGSTSAFTISVDQDTWIRSDQPTINKAADINLHVRNEAAGIERILLRYDLSPIAARASILSATGWFYITASHPEGPIDIHLTSADWIETDATWDSMNANMDAGVLATIRSQSAVGVWVAVNLTAQAQAWVNGAANYGITLNSTVDGVHGQYQSRESGHPPYLEVVVGTPPTSPARLRSTSKIDGGGAATLERNAVYLRQSPASHIQLVLNDGAGQDVMLDSFYSSRNYGNHEIEVETIGSDENSLIRFDRLAIPPGARINTARLELYHYMTESTQVNPGVEVYRVTRDWVEGTLDGTGTADGATWQTWDGSSDWTQTGGDHDVSPVASSDISAAINDWETWEIGELVQGWIDGTYPNYGLLLKGTGSIEVRFASKEDADPALRPRLTISYSCTCGEVCMAPQGSGKIALIGDDNSPDPDDQIKIAIIESWGYDVDFYEDQAADTINWSNYDLAYVSETTISSGFSGNPATIPIGVVNEEPKLYDEFLLASSGSGHVGDTIDIVDNSHYITSVFPQGPLPIYTGAMEILSANTPLAADLQTLGEFSGAASLTALEKGAMTTSGTGATARRVTLPLGQHFAAGFDWSKLNSNGYLLVQRAIEWGMNKGKGAVGNLLMVVPAPSSLNSRDSSKKDLIESWNYAVTLIDDSDSQSNIDTAAAANDVIYVSGSISGGALADKLTGSPTPIVNEFNGKLDNFGFSSSTGTAVATDTFTVTNAAHYISQPFGGGAVTHFTTSLTMPVPSGTLAPDLETVGETSGATRALVTLDTGATRWDGNPAPARRAHLPFGAAETSQMTDEGKTLMLRAIEWANGANLPAVPSQLLFVVPDPASLGAADAAKKSLFESWGYAVNSLDDDATLSDYGNATAANDVVYVSATAVAASVGSKLFKSPVGVVNGNSGLHDDFGFSTVRYTGSTNAPLDTVASHYITQPFAGGAVTLYTSDQSSGAAVGTLAAGLEQIGLWSSGGLSPLGGLLTMDAGAMTSIVENTPGRRVQMPWDNLDVSTLTNDGRTILRRSLEWAGSTATFCDADYIPDTKLGEFLTSAYGSNNIQGLTYLPQGKAFNGVAVPADGAWISVNYADGRFYMTDMAGNYLTDMAPPIGAPTGVAYVASGTRADHLAAVNQTIAELEFYDLSGTLAGSFSVTAIGSAVPTGVTFIGATAGGVYDDHLAISDSNADMVFLVTQDGTLVSSFDTSSFSLRTNDLAHIPGTDKLLLIDRDGIVFIVDFTGTMLDQYDVTGFGTTVPEGIAINTATCDHVVGDDTPNLVVTLNQGDGGGDDGPYVETYQPWSATADNTWQTVDLAPLGVPADAVVEVAVINSNTGKERWGGVRAIGSALERRFRLHEAENGGVDAFTLHVQTDASSRIEHYSERKAEVSFVLLGYWSGGAYVELFETFSAGAANAWVAESVDDEGLGPNQVAEVVIQNTSSGAERLAGVRATGSSINRRFDLHEAEAGGVDAVSLMVATDAASTIEAYAENTTDIEFYVVGFWSTPPGTWTELGGTSARSTPTAAWGVKNIASLGVPPNSVAQFVITNDTIGAENTAGARSVGSAQNRFVDLQEAEAGGSDLVSMHVNVDASTDVEWYSESGTSGVFFFAVGAWVLSP